MTWDELNEVRDFRQIIDDTKKEVAALRRSLSLKVPARDGLPKAMPLDSPIERLTIRIVDSENEIADLERRLDEELAPRLERRIKNEVSDSTARTLFVLRYVDGLFFRDIALVMGYSLTHIYYLHRATLDKIISQ